jgi:hypothetical protein
MRRGLVALAAGWLGSAGCIQNYYPAPICDTGTVQYGSVCDVPAAGGSTVVKGSTGTTVSGTPPRVVVSQPSSGSRFSWHRSDPESSLATTKVEGAIEEPTITR